MITFRKVIFWMHLICGVVGGLVVFIMSATGVALTYERQMSSWAEGVEIEAPAAAARLGPEELLTRARLETGKVPSGITFHADPREPARVSFGRDSVAINPYLGDLLAESGGDGLERFFQQMTLWHRWLGQDGDGRAIGKALTGACNLAFLFIVVSGLYLWWPKKWTRKHLRPIVWFRGGLPAKARDFNWHNVMGFWCAVPLFFVVGTAVFFSYSWAGDMLYALTGETQPQRGGAPGRGPGGPGGGGPRGGGPERGGPEGRGPGRDGGAEREVVVEGLDVAWAAAQNAVDGWRTMSLRLPSKPGGPVSVSVDRGNGGMPQLRSTLTVDGKTGEVLKHETFEDQGAARRIRSYIRFLHTGEVFGFIGQTIAGVASLAACFLVYTGWMLTWRRFRAWQERR